MGIETFLQVRPIRGAHPAWKRLFPVMGIETEGAEGRSLGASVLVETPVPRDGD